MSPFVSAMRTHGTVSRALGTVVMFGCAGPRRVLLVRRTRITHGAGTSRSCTRSARPGGTRSTWKFEDPGGLAPVLLTTGASSVNRGSSNVTGQGLLRPVSLRRDQWKAPNPFGAVRAADALDRARAAK